MNPLTNALTRYVVGAGGAILVASGGSGQPRQATSFQYVSTSFQDGAGYTFNKEEDRTVFEIPVVSTIRIKLKKGFQPFEFYIGD
jgi:hypothetical protein